MIWKNLLRRKVRTLLTVLGIAVGVTAIIGLGALADGLQAGYNAMLAGSRADLVLSQPDSYDISFSSVDESIGPVLEAMPEVEEVSGMVEGFAETEGAPLFFIFAYPEGSFALERFRVVSGVSLAESSHKRLKGKPALLGSAAAEMLEKDVGDTLRLGDTVYRVVGIYETGEAFENSGALLSIKEAQEVVGKPRQVNLYYIRLKDPALRPRLAERIHHAWPNLSLTTASEFGSKQTMIQALYVYVAVIGGLAIVIGGVSMMNAQLMAVYERTREIGVLRAVGWSRGRVMGMILGEAIAVCLAGGLLGSVVGILLTRLFSTTQLFVAVSITEVQPGLVGRAFLVVLALGLVGGLYPAWRAARLAPVEALRYEGGSTGQHLSRLPLGGLAVQGLWQRRTRTLLTVGAISLTVGAILALEAYVAGFMDSFVGMMNDVKAEIMIRQANVGDTGLSTIDERVEKQIAALPEVEATAGLMFTAVILPDAGAFFVVQGYRPGEFGMRRFNIVDGKPISGNHQIIIGKTMAEAMQKEVGDTLELSGIRYRIVGLYETGIGWEESGGVLTLRDAQVLMGKPRKLTLLGVKLRNPKQAQVVVEKINSSFPEVHASLVGDFANQMPDIERMNGMINGITFMAVLVGGLGVLNTMLMSVFERTREVGVLRALGWRRRVVMGLFVREAVLLGLLGGAGGLVIAFGSLAVLDPLTSGFVNVVWQTEPVLRSLLSALLLGVLGGLYPAWRATRLKPVEALRYE